MNSNPNHKAIFENFAVAGTFASCAPIGEGHINDTFLVKTVEIGCPDYVIQRINHSIFKNVDGLHGRQYRGHAPLRNQKS